MSGVAGQDCPGLDNRIDPSLLALVRAQPSAVIESRTAIPFAVPGLPLERLLHRSRMSAPASGAVDVAALSQRGEKRDGPHQKPTEPHAFALPAFTDPVHAVVPVAGADERQAVFAGEDRKSTRLNSSH